jgi:hypothetical protein
MLQNYPMVHKNASRVHQTLIVEHFKQFFQQIFFPRMKKNVDPPLLTQKLWNTLYAIGKYPAFTNPAFPAGFTCLTLYYHPHQSVVHIWEEDYFVLHHLGV